MIRITAQELYNCLHFERLFSALVEHYCTLLSGWLYIIKLFRFPREIEIFFKPLRKG